MDTVPDLEQVLETNQCNVRVSVPESVNVIVEFYGSLALREQMQGVPT